MIDVVRRAMFRYAPDPLVVEILARRMRRRALRAATAKPETLLVRRFFEHGEVAESSDMARRAWRIVREP